MSGYTPGPWELRRFTAYISGTNKRIAHADLAWKDSATCDANARLIAAAPSMYEALKTASFYMGLITDGEPVITDQATLEKHRSQVTTALALASPQTSEE